MKKVVLFLFVCTTIIACRGPRGHEGPEGPSGDSGNGVLGQTFEFEDIDFDYEPDNNIYSTFVEIPEEIEVLESDAILVYRLEIDDGVETFSLIPQDFFVDEGTVHYVFNHTDQDVELLIDGDFDMSNLSSDFTQDQIFRFVVVPSDFAKDPNVNIKDFYDLQAYDIELEEF